MTTAQILTIIVILSSIETAVYGHPTGSDGMFRAFMTNALLNLLLYWVYSKYFG